MALKIVVSLGALVVIQRLSSDYMEVEAELREKGLKKLVELDSHSTRALETGRSFTHILDEGTRPERPFFVKDPQIVQKLEQDRLAIINSLKQARVDLTDSSANQQA